MIPLYMGLLPLSKNSLNFVLTFGTYSESLARISIVLVEQIMSVVQSHSLYCMPLILVNFGGEMVYILHQRLQAQSVPLDKEQRVLREVIAAMYSDVFIRELFKPQSAYSMASTKQIFDKLAHSSLMRLNKSSMDKLFDLMSMSFKHQVISCAHPREIIQASLIHLEAIRNIIGKGSGQIPLMAMIDEATLMMKTVYGKGGPCSTESQYMNLRQALLQFVQDKKVKASLFLQKGIQNSSGMFNLKFDGPLPYRTEVPGTMKVYESKRLLKTVEFSVAIKAAENVQESKTFWNPENRIGENLYSMSTSSLCSANAAEDVELFKNVVDRLNSFFNEEDIDTIGSAPGFDMSAAMGKLPLFYSIVVMFHYY